ncbi:hypothetical protein [Azohydromonas australica]|uniref:hypothetical protein n=1 Tax=Azohydromonas australica TaxID=364039 RepID=UPI0012EBC629|nr:hypothetical protein [Azohydromonas australica]
MIAKHLNFPILSFIISLPAHAAAGRDSSGTIWEVSPTGKCFDSIPYYLSMIFGKQYSSDENIKTTTFRPTNYSKSPKDYVWAMDTTPSKNYTRTLFSVDKRTKRACAILFAPVASSVDFELQPSRNVPTTARSIDTPPPGFDTTEVIYRLNPEQQLYLPSKCYKITPKNKKTKLIAQN